MAGKDQQYGIFYKDFFKSEQQLLTELVSRQRNGELKLAKEMEAAIQLYSKVKSKASDIDKSLQQHVDALQARALKPLQELEKKLLRAEKENTRPSNGRSTPLKRPSFPKMVYRNGLIISCLIIQDGEKNSSKFCINIH
jgi:hypothetical protein